MEKIIFDYNCYYGISDLEKDLKNDKAYLNDILNRYNVSSSKDLDLCNVLQDNTELSLNNLEKLFDVKLNNDIILFGNLKRWNGSFSAYKLLDNYLDSILNNGCDCFVLTADSTNVNIELHDHDGVSYLTFRKFKKGVSEEQKENFIEKIYTNELTKKDIYHYTNSILPYVNDILGGFTVNKNTLKAYELDK